MGLFDYPASLVSHVLPPFISHLMKSKSIFIKGVAFLFIIAYNNHKHLKE